MRSLLRVLAVALACAWVYAPCLRGSWLWDDGLEISQNPVLRMPDGWWRPWIHPAGMDYFPLKSTLQWVEWHLWGANPTGYHLANLGLHCASALLVWRLLDRLGVRAAFLGGLLFAVHPLAVESVAWISEFKNTVSLPPLLLAALAYVDAERGGGRRALFRSLLWFVAALTCKTSVVMFPAVILLYAWWRQGRVGARDLGRAAPFLAAALVLGAATLWFQAHRAIGIAGTPAGLVARLAQAGWSLAAYARLCVWPTGLEPIYPGARLTAAAWVPWLATAALLVLFWRRRAGWGRHALLGSGWFLLNLAPVLGIVPMAYSRVSPLADHLAYVPLVGVVGLAAAAYGAGARACAARLGPGEAGRFLPATGAALVMAALAISAHAYAGVFVDEGALWTRAVERNPDAWLARNNLGRVLLQEGRPAEAAEQFRRAIARQPDSPEAHANLANALEALGRTEEARQEYAAALTIEPAFAGAHYNLGLSLLRDRRLEEAARELRAALAADPGHAAAHNTLGLALAGLGRLPEAMEQYRLALQLDSSLPEAHLNLGNALFRLGRLPEAVAEYREALRIYPAYSAAHANLGTALARLGRPAEADAEWEQARRSANH